MKMHGPKKIYIVTCLQNAMKPPYRKFLDTTLNLNMYVFSMNFGLIYHHKHFRLILVEYEILLLFMACDRTA